jgi:hypothetical protein
LKNYLYYTSNFFTIFSADGDELQMNRTLLVGELSEVWRSEGNADKQLILTFGVTAQLIIYLMQNTGDS